jgi:hypothetical protein
MALLAMGDLQRMHVTTDAPEDATATAFPRLCRQTQAILMPIDGWKQI